MKHIARAPEVSPDEDTNVQSHPPDSREPPYDGALSKTMLETIHVPTRDGDLRSLEIYRVINVLTDPALREAALSGRLHELEAGVSVAFSFVYHDPTLCKYALVVPESSRHHVMREHAKLLTTLAEDTNHAIPRYVRMCAVLVGHEELRRFVEETGLTPNVESDSAERDDAAADESGMFYGSHRIEELRTLLADREQRLRSREERIRARAERLTVREDELRTLEERLVTWERDLMMREHLLVARERNLADGLMVENPALESEVQEVDQDDDEDDEEVFNGADNYGSFRTSPHLPLSDSVELLDEANPQDEVETFASSSDDETASVDDTAVEDDDEDSDEEDDEAGADVQDVEDVFSTEGDSEDDYGGPSSAVHAMIETSGTGRHSSIEQLERPSLVALLDDESPAPSFVAMSMAKLVLLGARANAALLDALSAPKGIVRHACALSLGELRARHSIAPLIDLLRDEGTEIWQEIARIIPLFGTAAFRACVRDIEDRPQGNGERFAYVLAHFTEQGYGNQVEQLRAGSNAKVAKVARDAASHRETASRHEQMVRGALPVDPGDAMRAFSRLFYTELSKARGDNLPAR